MNIEIKPEETGGNIYIPPSKSISHRAIIAASLANGRSRIDHVLLSEDVKATLEAVKLIGAEIEAEQETEDGLFTLFITGNPEPQTHDALIDCEESGSTLRFLIPIIAIDAENTVLIGKGRLPDRPLQPYFDIFDSQGFEYEVDDKYLPLILNGELEPGEFKLKGDISSQFITGLLFALPLLDGDSRIILTTELESRPYVNLTLKVLSEFGINIEEVSDREFFIPGDQNYRPTSMIINGDYSQAAFWFVNGLINKETILKDLSDKTFQGDFMITSIINDNGGNVIYNSQRNDWTSSPAKFKAFNVNVSDHPDLVPILAIAAGLAEGTSRISGINRLKYKESNRVKSTLAMLDSYGISGYTEDDTLVIEGKDYFTGGTVDSFGDHRIAIAAAIGSGRATGDVIITEAQCVNKSYPNFWEDFHAAGGVFNELDVE